MPRLHRYFIFIFGLAALGYETALFAENVTFFPYEPGLSVTGMTGTFTQGAADFMIPVVGQPSTLAYLDPQGVIYSGNEFFSGAGLGVRTLGLTSNAILGAYVFGDYDHSENNHGFWFVSPGVEILTGSIDVSGNLYIPLGSETNTINTYFASERGNTQSVHFSGHGEMDTLVNAFESVGLGGDAEVGYRLPFFKNNTKIYAGFYYFSPDDADSITGGAARLEIPVSRAALLSFSEGYDTVNHNTLKVGLTVDLGGRNTHFHYDPDLKTRLLDPIHRNLAGISGSSHAAEPIEEATSVSTSVMSDNIWFFRETGTELLTDSLVTTASCTAENPCDFTQNNLTGINAITPGGAILFVESGTYTHLGGQVTVYNGQNIFGRTEDWMQVAAGSERPILVGALSLSGNSLVDSVQLFNDPLNVQQSAISLLDGAQNVAITDAFIGTTVDDPAHSYPTDVTVNNNTGLTLKNSVLNVYSVDQGEFNIQIEGNDNTLTLMDNQLSNVSGAASPDSVNILMDGNNNALNSSGNQFSMDSAADAGIRVAGFWMQGTHNSAQLSNDQWNILNTGNASVVAVLVIGNSNTLTIENSALQVNSSADNAEAIGIGEFAGFEGNNQINAVNDVINVTITGVASDAYGVAAMGVLGGDNIFNIINDNITVISEAGSAYGLFDAHRIAQSNQWSAVGTNIQANGAIESCPFKFDGICFD